MDKQNQDSHNCSRLKTYADIPYLQSLLLPVCELYEDSVALDNALKEKERELSSLKQRTANVAGANMNFGDTENVVNICEIDSSTLLEKQYKEFYANERMDAIEKLDKLQPNNSKATERLACRVFEVVYEETNKTASTLKSGFNAMMVNPCGIDKGENRGKFTAILCCETGPIKDGEMLNMQRELNNSLKNYLKKTATKVDITGIIEKSTRRLIYEIREGHSNEMVQLIYGQCEEKALRGYVDKCARLCWQLEVQTPPLHVDYSQTTFDSNKHKCPNGQHSPDAGTSLMYLWPTLSQSVRKGVMVKAEVVCVKSKRTHPGKSTRI
ncbi:uncharacterized protein LOC102805872 [Saccoglossus kowalevskii]